MAFDDAGVTSEQSELPAAAAPTVEPTEDRAPAKKRAAPFGAKSELIRRLPPDMPAKQVVEEGRKVGLRFTAAYVYRLRSRDQVKSKTVGPGLDAGASPAVGRDPDGLVTRLRSAIMQIGLARARKVFEELEAEFGA